MNKTRKMFAALTMVAVTATTGLSAFSSAQAHYSPWRHTHSVPGVGGPTPGTVIPTPVPGVGVPPPGTVVPTPVPGVRGPAPGTVLPEPDRADERPRRRNRGIGRGEAAALGVLGGIVIGGAIANATRRSTTQASLPVEHYLYCERKYRSFVATSNTFTGYDGQQHYCISPYVR